MTRATLLWPVLVLASASAAAAAPPAVHPLTTSERHLDLEFRGQRYGSIDYFRVLAQTPTLTAAINAELGTLARALGWLEATQRATGMLEISCEMGLATNTFVSFQCSRFIDDGPNTGGSVRVVETAAYFIDHDILRPATLANMFALPRAELAKRLAALTGHKYDQADEECHVSLDDLDPFVDSGIDFHDMYRRHGCVLDWATLAPLLSPAMKPIAAFERAPDDDDNPTSHWPSAPPRFVPGPDDTVTDLATGLVWATRDNGKDLTLADAQTYAKSFRAAGFTDWRLPTEAELELLAEPVLAHHEKTDCTRGKLATVLAPAFHPSCGIAWTSDTFGTTHGISFGLISGGARLSKRTDKKNHRALLVRSPVRAPVRPATAARPPS